MQRPGPGTVGRGIPHQHRDVGRHEAMIEPQCCVGEPVARRSVWSRVDVATLFQVAQLDRSRSGCAPAAGGQHEFDDVAGNGQLQRTRGEILRPSTKRAVRQRAISRRVKRSEFACMTSDPTAATPASPSARYWNSSSTITVACRLEPVALAHCDTSAGRPRGSVCSARPAHDRG